MTDDLITRVRSVCESDVHWSQNPFHVQHCLDVLAALDAQAAEIERLRVWSSDSHVTELEEAVAVRDAEIERLRTMTLPDVAWDGPRDERWLLHEISRVWGDGAHADIFRRIHAVAQDGLEAVRSSLAKDAEIERLREHLALLAEAIPYDPECMACTSGDYRVRDGEHPLHCAMRTAAEYQEDSDD